MESELQILIAELQREHDYLENELNACLKGWDFEGANAFKEPLFYTREKIRILKNIENPAHDKIISLKGKIERFKNYEMIGEYSKFPIQNKEDLIHDYEKELSQLENKERRFHYDSDELTICLEKILSKKISQFEIEVDEILFVISRKKTTLIIEILRTDNHTFDYPTTRKGLTELKRMGFEVSEQNAIKEISDFQEDKISPTIELLSRIAYEVFRLYGDKKAKIKMRK